VTTKTTQVDKTFLLLQWLCPAHSNSQATAAPPSFSRVQATGRRAHGMKRTPLYTEFQYCKNSVNGKCRRVVPLPSFTQHQLRRVFKNAFCILQSVSVFNQRNYCVRGSKLLDVTSNLLTGLPRGNARTTSICVAYPKIHCVRKKVTL